MFVSDLHRANHKINFVSRNTEKGGVASCGILDIPYDGVPFLIAGKKAFECRHGSDKGVSAKLKWKKIADEKLVGLNNHCLLTPQ